MKTSLFLLSTWLAVVVALAQDSPIGGYSMSEWAHTNLNVNRALETGASGKLLGYKSTGVIGLLDPASGGGGSDTNAVAAVPDLATLTNTVTGYTKAIVGTGTTQKLYQRLAVATLQPGNTNDFIYVGTPSATTDNGFSFLPDGTVRCVSANAATTLGLRYNSNTVVGNWYHMVLDVRGNAPEYPVAVSIAWDEYTWYTTSTITPTYQTFHVKVKAATNLGMTFYTTGDGSFVEGDYLEFINYYYSESVEDSELPDGITFFASAADPGYGWKQVYLESQGGGGLTTKTIDVPAVNYQFVPDTDVIVINSTTPFTEADYMFTGNPIILPGVDGQYLTITNLSNADLQFSSGAATGITAESSLFTIASDIKFDQYFVGYFRFNGPTARWDAIGRWPILPYNVEATLLPAPWPPPDTNGVQTLPANVKDALIVELVPWFLTNSARLFPNGLVSTNAITP